MHQVKDERITNEKVRERFGGIDKVCNFATRRRLDFLGHTLRQEDKKLTKKLLTCWIQHPRACGGQQLTLKDANFNAINWLLDSNNFKVEKNGPTAAWAEKALDPANWKALVKETRYIRPKQKKGDKETSSATEDQPLRVVATSTRHEIQDPDPDRDQEQDPQSRPFQSTDSVPKSAKPAICQ
jgi:hypothetical protein